MRSIGRSLLALALSLAAPALHALQFTSMEPGYGAPGDSITLNGMDFDPMASYTVTVDGVTAVIEEVQTDFLRFTIPVGAATGPVEVTLDMETFTYFSDLTITRDITVTLDPALPAYTDDYLVATLYDEDLPPGPNFTVPVVDGEATIVVAAGADSEPGLLGVATGLDPSLELSAESSALALAFMVHPLFTIDPTEAQTALGVLAGLPETTVLAQLIQDEIDATSDYLSNNAIDVALQAAVEAYFVEIAQAAPAAGHPEAPEGGGPPPIHDDFINSTQNFAASYPKDLEVLGFEGLNRLAASALPEIAVSEAGVPTVGIYMDQAPLDSLNELISDWTGGLFEPDMKATSLEWLAIAYELDPSDPSIDTKAKVDALEGSHTAIYDRLRPGHVSKRLISAKPATGYADILGTAANLIFNAVFPVFAPEKDVRISAARSGLYMVRSFSGARFPPQAGLVDPMTGLPGGQAEHVKLLMLNILMATNETCGIILKAEDIIGDDKLAEILGKLEVALTSAAEKQLAVGPLDASFIFTVFNESVKLLSKELTSAAVKKAVEGGLTAAAPKLLGKVVFKTLNVMGKVASVAKVAERVAALSNVVNYAFDNAWMAQSVQSTVAVIGDPWRPEITSFSPRQGHKGRIIRISGRRFSPTIADNIVVFGYTGTSPETQPMEAMAEVLEAGSNFLKVRVPQEAMTGPISVAIDGKGSFSSTALAPPYNDFVVLEPPVITDIQPNPPPAGGVARIIGDHFATGYGINVQDQNIVKFASEGGAQTPVEVARPTSLLVRIPDNGNPNSVTVQTEGCPPPIIAECTSNAFPFTAALPPSGAPGGTIYVTTTSDGDVADGDISLHEALLIASGTLSRPLTMEPNPRPPDTTYESDFADKDASGASKRDHILPHATYPGGTIVLTTALPPLESFDRIELPDFVIDGTAVAGPALVVDGKSGIEFDPGFMATTTFQNFGGHGLYLFNGASANEFLSLVIEDCGGEGVFLDTDAMDNMVEAAIDNCAGNGVKLSGTAVVSNEIWTTNGFDPGTLSNDNNDGFGVLLEDGAAGNQLYLGHTSNNAMGGVRVTGAGTEDNKIIGGETDPVEIFDNGGPGVWVDVPNTYIHGLNIAGNMGDGVLVEGSDTHSVKLEWIFAGYVYAANGFTAGDARGNQGNGIHYRNGTHDNEARQLYLGSNDEHGVLITGADVHDINIRSGYIGRPYYSNPPFLTFVDRPNGKSGIAVMAGAHDNVIGDPIPVEFGSNELVRVMNHQTDAPDSGAGILLSGADTRDNIVFASILGSDGFDEPGVGNRYGIHITDGAHANIIGLRGYPGTPTVPSTFTAHNLFQNNTVAGILLESGGSLPGGTGMGEPQTPKEGNVIQNNYFGHDISEFHTPRPNHVGILIREGGVANRIGGSQDGEANYFWDNDRAGIEIEGGTITRPDLANRIVGNVFQNQGSQLAPETDPLSGDPFGVGVMISGGASGHVIGGEGPGEANRIVAGEDASLSTVGNVVGVYIDASSNNRVVGNQIGADADDGGNIFAGVIIRDGSGNTIGPGNRIGPNGDPFTVGTLGGVAISGGSGNDVIGNHIGPAPDQAFNPDDPFQQKSLNGVLILNSPDNIIGDYGAEHSNVIINSASNGVRIEGAGSTGNRVANNLIGISPLNEPWATGNGGNGVWHGGVLITGGASDNEIGGEALVLIGRTFVPAPVGNHIRNNRGDGVRVEAASVGNTITNNSISGHSARPGIENTGGGNNELEPPAGLAFDGAEVSGTVNPAMVPDGSIVQIFSDPDDEGLQWLADAVVDGAAFSAPVGMVLFSEICATVTHAVSGNTSEFSCFTPVFSAALDIRRAEEPPAAIEIAPGEDSVIAVIALTTDNLAAEVESMNFTASGSADESTDITGVSLYWDSDENGLLTLTDQLLAGPVTVGSDDGEAMFPMIHASIPSNTVQHWLLVVSLDAGAALGQTIEFSLPNNGEVDSINLFPPAPIVEVGNFPVQSDIATIAINLPPTPEEIQQAITSGVGLEPDMDVNGDGQIDVADVVAAGQP